MIRCSNCHDPLREADAINGLCFECDDIVPAPPAEPLTISEQFHVADALHSIWGVDVGDPHRDWGAAYDQDKP